jgi:hypothetical protein
MTVTLFVVLLLIWTKRSNIAEKEQFQTSDKAVDPNLLDTWHGRLKVERICKPISDTVNRTQTGTGMTDFKINTTVEKIPCAAILNRKHKPRSKQAALAMLALANDFIKIFNYEGAPIPSINAQHRKDFIDIILSQCNAVNESTKNLNDIRTRLSNKSSITLEEALYLINNYPCVRENCKSIIRRVMLSYPGTIKTNIDGTVTYSIVTNLNEATPSSQISMKPGDSATGQITLAPDFVEINTKFIDIMNSYCEPVDTCIQGVQIEETPEFDKALNELAKSYPASLAMDIMVSKNELFKDPKNKEIINEPMEIVSNAETVVKNTQYCTNQEFLDGMSAKEPLA